MSCVDRSDSFVHHLLSCLSLRRPIRRSKHRGSTYNTVYSVVKEQEGTDSYNNTLLWWSGASAARTHPPGLSCRICPSVIQYISGAKLRGFYEFFSKIFPSCFKPRSMLSFTDIKVQPSALAISEILIPKKKCA